MKPYVVVSAMVVLVAGMAAGIAAGDNPGVVPLGLAAPLTGKTYAEWADAWSQWQGSIPPPANPCFDTTGQKAAVGQGYSSTVFFLTSVPGTEGAAERSVTIPRSRFLFIPVANVWNSWCPSIPGCSTTLDDYLVCSRPLVTMLADSFTGVHASIDGTEVEDLSQYRAHSDDWYSMFLPQNSILDPYAPLSAGFLDYCYQDGHYLLLYPLSLGTHDVNFGYTCPGLGPGCGGTWNITYHLTVR